MQDRSRANIGVKLTNHRCIPNIESNRFQTDNIQSNQKYLCQKEHFRVEFGVGIDNTLNMSSRKKVPDPTRPGVSNRLPVTSHGSRIILEPSIPSKQASQTTSRLDTRLSNSPAVSPGAMHGIHGMRTAVRPAGNVQPEGPALKREMVTMSRRVLNTSSPKGKGGRSVVMILKPRAPGLKITEMTQLKYRGKRKQEEERKDKSSLQGWGISNYHRTSPTRRK